LFRETAPRYFINLKEISDIIYCEYNRERCYNINSMPLKNIIELCEKYNVHLIQLSSSYIYKDNNNYLKEDSEIMPDSVYADSKFLAEKIIIESKIRYTIIRAGEKFFENGSYLNNIINYLSNNKKVSIVKNQKLSIIFYKDIIKFIEFLIKKDLSGIYNYCTISSVNIEEFVDIYIKEYKIIRGKNENYNIKTVNYEEYLFPVNIQKYNMLSLDAIDKSGFKTSNDLYSLVSDHIKLSTGEK
jgi:dTDP-4-dehydrorhamnose reductase